jgi:hypothetical protein
MQPMGHLRDFFLPDTNFVIFLTFCFFLGGEGGAGGGEGRFFLKKEEINK